MRGSSNARAGADFVLAVTCDRDAQTGETSNHRIALEKNRDAVEGPIASLHREPVVIGHRPDGTTVTSLVLSFSKSTSVKASAEGKPERIFREAYERVVKDVGDDTVSVEEVHKVFVEIYDGTKEAIRKAFPRAREILADTFQFSGSDTTEKMTFIKRQFEASAREEFQDELAH